MAQAEAGSEGEAPSHALRVRGWGDAPHRGIYAALLLVSLGLLVLEVSLTRLFSFTVWYHFAYLTISMALLGFGASGAIVAAFPRLFERRGEALLVGLVVAGAVLTLLALVFVTRFPIHVLDVTRAPGRFSAWLLAYYLAVGLPFLLAGFAVSIPFASYPRLMGRLYFWDLLGAALGCLLSVVLISTMSVPGLVILAAGLMLAAAAALSRGRGARAGLAAVALVVALGAAPAGKRLPIEVTPTKVPPTVKANPDRPDLYSEWTALNRVDAAGWKFSSKYQYWGNNGLSERYKGKLPDVAGITYDGCNGSHIYSFSGDLDDFAMFDFHILRTPYLVLDAPKVLVIGVGGGVDMVNAIRQGARHVTGAELQPKTVELLKERLREFTGDFYHRPDVSLVASEGRHFVRRSGETFDLVQVTTTDTFAAQATGAYVLAESYLYTVGAVKDYLSHLSEDGILTMVVGDIIYEGDLPPLGVRTALTGFEAIRDLGAPNPENHLMVVTTAAPKQKARTEVVMLKKSEFSAAQVASIEAFADEHGFAVAYAPAAHGSREYEFAQVLGPDEALRQRVIEESSFRLDPVHDDDPFFYNVGKWSNFPPERSLYFMFPGSYIGHLVLILMVLQSFVLGSVLIGLPLLRGAREGLRAPSVVSYLAYFLALGVGFMFIEISFVQSFVLFLGSPTHALSITIFSLLLFSSLGSLLSTRFVETPEWAVRRGVVLVAVLVGVYAFGLSRLFESFLHLDFGWRVAIAVAAQLPMGLTLGTFMPLGIACISREHPRLVPWAWGINGIGSVVGTTLAVVLAMAWGFTVVALVAAGLYAVGVTLMLRAQRPAAA